MNRELPPYASSYRDRHGKLRVRFRKTGFRRTTRRPRLERRSSGKNIWRGRTVRRSGQGRRGRSPAFDDLITRFYSSVKWKNIPKESTRSPIAASSSASGPNMASAMVATMSARAVNGLMEKMADTPAAANNLLKRLRTLFDYAILLGMRRDNPAKAVDSVKAKGDGFHEWTEAEIAKFRGSTRSARRRGWRWRYSSAPLSGARTRPRWARSGEARLCEGAPA
jgi:hypothetical protein